MEKLWNSVTRTKRLEAEREESLLCRCLTTFDITLLGLGVFIGSGIFIMTGIGIKEYAGSSIQLSFLISGIVAFLSVLCFAEFASHVQITGSHYIYIYATLGEFIAFITGWNTIFLYVLDCATEVRAFSVFIDSLTGGIIRNKTIDFIGKIEVLGLAEYPDFLAVLIILCTILIVAYGVKLSVNFTNIMTTLSVALLLVIIIMAYVVADGTETWTNPIYGGFFPFGASGTVNGASLLFLTYMGFDGLPLMAEEAKDPTKSVPIAMLVSLSCAIVLYFCASSSLSLLVPFFDIDITNPYAAAFAANGILWANYVVAAAIITAGVTAILGIIVPLGRLPYAMSCDGLLFQCLSYVHPKTQVPLLSLIILGILSGILALIVNIELMMYEVSSMALINFLMVSVSLIYFRYTPEQPKKTPKTDLIHIYNAIEMDNYEKFSIPEIYQDSSASEEHQLLKSNKSIHIAGTLKERFHFISFLVNLYPGQAVKWALFFFLLFSFLFLVILVKAGEYLFNGVWWACLLMALFALGMIMCIIIIMLHHQNNKATGFKVPLVPILPCISIVLLLFLMINITIIAWCLVFVWMVLGCIVYFAYGMRHSVEKQLEIKESNPNEPKILMKDSDVPRLNQTITQPQPITQGTSKKESD